MATAPKAMSHDAHDAATRDSSEGDATVVHEAASLHDGGADAGGHDAHGEIDARGDAGMSPEDANAPGFCATWALTAPVASTFLCDDFDEPGSMLRRSAASAPSGRRRARR